MKARLLFVYHSVWKYDIFRFAIYILLINVIFIDWNILPACFTVIVFPVFFRSWKKYFVFLLCGALWMVIINARSYKQILIDEGLVAEHIGVIVDYPEDQGTARVFDLKIVSTKPYPMLVERNVRVFMHGICDAGKGDLIEIKEKIKNIPQEKLDYFKSENVAGIISTFNNCRILQTEKNFLKSVLYSFRELIISRSKRIYSYPQGDFMLGVVLGYKTKYDEEFTQMLRQGDLLHIVVVSGYNVGLVLNFLLKILGIINKKFACLVGSVMLLIYLFLVGENNIPALRAVIFSIYFLFASLSGRKAFVVNGFAFCILILLILNPYVYKGISFQLSFFSSLGLAYFNFNKLAEKCKAFYSIIISKLSTIPVSLPVFKYSYLSGIIPNLLFAPFISIVTISGFINLFFTAINSQVADVIAYYLRNFLDLFFGAASLLNSIFLWEISEKQAGYIWVLVLIAAIFAFEMHYQSYRKFMNLK